MILKVWYDSHKILFGLRTGERKSINSELWHACAGPLVSLPPVGSLVVYFPQGHSEQVCTSSPAPGASVSFFSFVRKQDCGIWILMEPFDNLNLQVAASMQKETDFIPNYPNLPSKLICMLHNVTLHVWESRQTLLFWIKETLFSS